MESLCFLWVGSFSSIIFQRNKSNALMPVVQPVAWWPYWVSYHFSFTPDYLPWQNELSGSSNVITMPKPRRMKLAGYVPCMGKIRNAYNILVGKHLGKITLGKPRHRWEDNLRMDLRDGGWESVEWIHLTQDRDKWWTFRSTVMNIRLPLKAVNFLSSWMTSSFSGSTVLNEISQLVS